MRPLRIISALGIALAFAASLAQPAVAQRQSSAAGTRLRDYGLFAGLDLRFGDVMGEFGTFVGAHAAVLLKNRVYLGIAGTGLATDNAVFVSADQAKPEPIRMGYGGLLLGYVVPTPSLLHATLDVVIGGGGVDVSPNDATDIDGEDADAVFVFEPSATVEVKLTPFARIGVGAGYRFVGDLDLAGMRDADVRGVTGLITIRIGKF